MDAPLSGTISTAALFELVWLALARVLGTPATATLMRRAARAAGMVEPKLQGLEGLAVVRDELEYRYVLPPSWQGDDAESRVALGYLLNEQLLPLLAELAGPVGVRLIERLPELERHGILGKGKVA